MRTCTVLLSLVLPAAVGYCQSLTFEVASVKPSPVGKPIAMIGFLGGPGSDDPGKISSVNTSLKLDADRGQMGSDVKPADDTGVDLFAAVESQLGLRLASKKAPCRCW